MAKVNALPHVVIVGSSGNRVSVDSSGALNVNAAFSGSVSASQEYEDGASPSTVRAVGLSWKDSSGAVHFTASTRSLPVTVVSGGGGGQEYEDGATPSTQRGAAMTWKDSSGAMWVASSTRPLPVEATVSVSTIVDISDKALRDLGKVDIASLDQYAPVDVATDASTHSAFPVTLLFPAAGAGVSAPGDANGLKVQGASTVVIASGNCTVISTQVSLAPSTHSIGKLAAQDSTGINVGKVKVFGNSTAVIQGNCTVVSTQVSLAPSTHPIGKLAANSGVDIGDVDVLSYAHGKTLKTISGTVSSNGDNNIGSSGVERHYCAYSFTTDDAGAGVTVTVLDGRAGTERWRARLHHPTSGMAGANLAVAAPSELFASTVTSTVTSLNLSAASTLHYSLTFWEV